MDREATTEISAKGEKWQGSERTSLNGRRIGVISKSPKKFDTYSCQEKGHLLSYTMNAVKEEPQKKAMQGTFVMNEMSKASFGRPIVVC
jgi:hypothetical protein